ncbi:alpha-hydroxy acid oxidase [Roseobacteraceae bacterium S113]
MLAKRRFPGDQWPMGYETRYPALWTLAARARRRMPHFAWEYLDSGTGMEHLLTRNRTALDDVRLSPRALTGRFSPDVSTSVLGQNFTVPFGIAPVGLGGLMWPGAETALARAARDCNMPYTLSLVANETPEATARIAGQNLWMQLYCPRDPQVRADLLARGQAAGIDTLVVTVDVPVNSRRERQLSAGITVPPKIDAKTLWRIATRPAWAMATMAYGPPRFKTLEPYFGTAALRQGAHLIGDVLDGRPDWDTFEAIRAAWPGKLVIKGIMHFDDARQAKACGADAIWVSNHGGRQFDASPAAIEALPLIVDEIAGTLPIFFDSGIRSGLDIVRALALGADFCFLGRGFMTAIGALGEAGPKHAYDILKADLETNMIQLGARRLSDLKGTAL